MQILFDKQDNEDDSKRPLVPGKDACYGSVSGHRSEHESGSTLERCNCNIDTSFRIKGRHKVANYSCDTCVIGPRPKAYRTNRSTLIEPVIFFFLVGKALSDTVITNLLEYQTCKVHLALPDRNCSDPISPVVEDLVQPTTANIIMGRAVIEAFATSCQAILIGPWSDVNGRKPFLVISFTGITLSYLCWGVLALLPHLPPEGYLLASLPLALSGGPCAVYMLANCYISDIAHDEHTRTFRLSMLVLAIYISSMSGLACAPLLITLQKSFNPYPLVFFLSALLLLMTTLYTYLYIQESVDVQPVRERRLFLFRHARDLVSTCFKARNGHARAIILLIIASFTTNVFMAEGESAILYLSVREMFSWQLSDFSIFSCFLCIVSGLGSPLGERLFTFFLGLPNMPVVAILLFTRCVRSTLMAISDNSFNFYLGVLAAFFITAYGPLCRSELSRLVPRQDLGKIFALTAFLESITPVGASPLYTFIYKATFLNNPATVFWLSTMLCASTVLMIIIVVIIQKHARGTCYVTQNL